MNIEECIERLKDLRLYCLSIGYEFDEDAEAIEWILTAYEKEKEKNKKARDYIYDLLNNDDIINIGIDDIKIILDMLEEQNNVR